MLPSPRLITIYSTSTPSLAYSLTSISNLSTTYVAVGFTKLRLCFTQPSGSSTSMPSSSSSAFLRFVASQCKYCKLCRGAGLRATLSGGAANHRTSFVSGSRSKCLARGPEISSHFNKNNDDVVRTGLCRKLLHVCVCSQHGSTSSCRHNRPVFCPRLAFGRLGVVGNRLRRSTWNVRRADADIQSFART